MAKISRDAFLYLEPHGNGAQFAQCSTCVLYNGTARRCLIHGAVEIAPDASCGLYVPGGNRFVDRVQKLVTPEESGLVHRQVRCENCRHFGRTGDTCLLFREINRLLPQFFDLDAHVHPQACCNAQTPRGANPAKAAADKPRAPSVAHGKVMA